MSSSSVTSVTSLSSSTVSTTSPSTAVESTSQKTSTTPPFVITNSTASQYTSTQTIEKTIIDPCVKNTEGCDYGLSTSTKSTTISDDRNSTTPMTIDLPPSDSSNWWAYLVASCVVIVGGSIAGYLWNKKQNNNKKTDDVEMDTIGDDQSTRSNPTTIESAIRFVTEKKKVGVVSPFNNSGTIYDKGTQETQFTDLNEITVVVDEKKQQRSNREKSIKEEKLVKIDNKIKQYIENINQTLIPIQKEKDLLEVNSYNKRFIEIFLKVFDIRVNRRPNVWISKDEEDFIEKYFKDIKYLQNLIPDIDVLEYILHKDHKNIETLSKELKFFFKKDYFDSNNINARKNIDCLKFYNVISSSKEEKIKDRKKLEQFFNDKFVFCVSDSISKIKASKISEKIDTLGKNFVNYITQINALKNVVDVKDSYFLERVKNLLGSFELIEKEFRFIKNIIENIKDNKDNLVFDKEIKKIDDFLNFILKSKDNLNQIIGINVINNEVFDDLTDSEIEEDDVSQKIQLNPNAQNVSLNQ